MATNQPDGTGGPSLLPDTSAFIHDMRARRHANDKDLKVVITQRDSETGGGKTTAAVWLALCWDQHGWNGAKKGMTDPQRFIDTFPDLPKHSVLVLDEAEELDARRSMAEENVQFSKKWMKMRTRQVDSILTLPTTSALDSRLKELADVRIHVTRRGRARVYRIKVDDRTGEVDERYVEHWSWPDVSGHKEFEELDKSKQEDLDAGATELSEDTQTEKAEVKEKVREMVREGQSHREIAGKPPEEFEGNDNWPSSGSTVSRWMREVKPDA